MRRLASFALLVGFLATSAAAESSRFVTVKELFALNHQLTVEAGTEAVWGDPHFERVWFASGAGAAIKRTARGFEAVFDAPGRYRGFFTVVGGHTSGDVYSITVIVRER